MDFVFESNEGVWDKVFKDDIIDLSMVRYFDPWTMGLIALKAIEHSQQHVSPSIILPDNADTIPYLKMMELHNFLTSLGYEDKYFANFKSLEMKKWDVQKIVHCQYRDAFNARLSSQIRGMLQNFGLKISDEQKVTSLIGELGNNVFDHNEGSWPTNIGGAILIGQKYTPYFSSKNIRFIVADPGVGFIGSLSGHTPPPGTHEEALKLGLSGVTGRIGEKRGNGLQLIQKWTINDFSGEVRIHTGNALVILSKDGMITRNVRYIQGTLAELLIRYR